MLITNREKRIIEKGIEDYNFIKSVLDRMNFETLEDVQNCLLRIKDIDITNLDETEGYLDFYYKDLSLCVSKSETIKLCNCMSIWDKEIEEYLFDFNSIEYIEEQLNKDKYAQINETLNRIKDNELKGISYNWYKEELIKFMQEML